MSWDWRKVDDVRTPLDDFIRTINSKLTALASLLVSLWSQLFNAQDYHILDYGGKWDGVTDDSVALLATMTAASAAGGGVVRLGIGTGLADPPATSLPANVVIRGYGIGRTTMNAVSTTACWRVTDVSNVDIKDFTFVGKSNSGVSATTYAIHVNADSADVENVHVRRVRFRQFKATEVVRVAGDGDLNTGATTFARQVTVKYCEFDTYYDQNNTSLGVSCYAIFFGYGCTDVLSAGNRIDGSYGKHGVGFFGQVERGYTIADTILDCGFLNGGSNFGYGILAYSGTSATDTQVKDLHIIAPTIRRSARAGIYLQGVNRAVVTGPILDQCDYYSAGLGAVGTGAFCVLNHSDDARTGPVAITGGTITDPGFAALYLSTGSSGRSQIAVSAVVCRMTASAVRYGAVIFGHGVALDDTCTFRGFRQNVFIYNAAANDCGDLTIGGQYDCSPLEAAWSGATTYANGAYASTGTVTYISIQANNLNHATSDAAWWTAITPTGVTSNTTDQIGPLKISARWTACAAAISMSSTPVTQFSLIGNIFTSCITAIDITATRGVVSGNISDGGTYGLRVRCTAATTAARIAVSDNLMAACLNPFLFVENTGKILVGAGNDFGVIGGYSADQGDASVALVAPFAGVTRWDTQLTANRTATLPALGAINRQRVRVLRNAGTPGAFTLAVLDGVSGGTLYTIAANTKGWVDVEFDGTNWQFAGYATIP